MPVVPSCSCSGLHGAPKPAAGVHAHPLLLPPHRAAETSCWRAKLSPWLLQVAGNFHFAPGKSFSANGMHVHDLVPFQDRNFDLSHTIKTLAFGKEYPGMNNPLDSVTVNQSLASSSMGQTGMWQYFLKVSHLLLLLAWAFTNHPSPVHDLPA